MVQYSRTPFDPFTGPAATSISEVRVRDRVAVAGTVTDLRLQHWMGGTPALHVTVTDDTGSLVVAFLGRTTVGGVEPGCAVTVAGTVITRRGRPLIMNPYVWLKGGVEVVEELADERAFAHA